MPSQSSSSQHGIRSHRSTAPRLSGRLITALVVSTFFLLIPPTPAFAEYVFVDPGHGGRYPGAVYAGVREADVNLWIALEVKAALAAQGHRVGMTRTSDVTVGPGPRPSWHWDDDGIHLRYCDASCSHDAPIQDLQARVDMANRAGADLFISIHNNAGSSSARGTETYHNWDNDTDLILSQQLARYIQQDVVREASTRDRGTYGVGFYVIRWSNMPAILIEVGFLSNSTDRALLLTPSFRRDVARGIALGVSRFLATDPFTPLYPRTACTDRYGTAAEIARHGWPDGAGTVFLASGVQWPDSLAATSLAAKLDAPILLTAPGFLPEQTAAALAELSPNEIVILGGRETVSPEIEVQAAAAAGMDPGSVRRIAGRDRFETAALIAEEIGVPPEGTIFVVSGKTYPDALSVSSYAGMIGAPILMSHRSELPEPTQSFLEAHASRITAAIVIGDGAVIDDYLTTDIAGTASSSVVRVSGPDRYETNLAVMRTFWPTSPVEPFVTTSYDFPDALVAGVLAAREGQPILLVGPKYLPSRTRELLMNDADRIDGFTMIGGERAVSALMEWELQKAMR